MRDTEDVYFNMGMMGTGSEDSEDVFLLTKLNNENTKRFADEARKSAVLDSACSSTVCGEVWLEDYLTSLNPEDRDKVIQNDSAKVFKFGGGERLKSKGSFRIPATVAGKDITITTDVVESDIPLLLSKQAMKQACVKLDLKNDTAEIFGKSVVLNETTSGHYCIPIDKMPMVETDMAYAVNIENLNQKEKHKVLTKLHRQFAHPPSSRFVTLLKDAGVWKEELSDIVEKIDATCDVCKRFKKSPSKPVVAMPMATRFNQKVCMDLKQWRNQWILHLIDMWSRFSISVFINRKRPSDIIDKIMTCWIGASFGVMEAIVSDNGGEFSSDEMRQVCSILNVDKITTAAYSPYQNGLCERNHAVIDSMLLKMEEQCPDTPLDVLLGWANMAKNSLQMCHGYSSYQLVFGKNPNLPNIMTAQPPALEGTSTSEILVRHLNGLHAARKAFIESENDERIRRALRNKIRASETIYNPGDKVYYKRDLNNRWLGPAKVIFQDGKVVFVRHGATFVRVAPNQLTLVNGIVRQTRDNVETRGDEFEPEESSSRARVTVFEEDSGDETLETHQKDSNLGQPIMQRPEQNGLQRSRRIDFKKNDKVEYRAGETDEWTPVVILGRGGKISGNHRNWFNVKDSEGKEHGVNFDRLYDWRKLERVEEVNVVLIPKEKHRDPKCHEAKLEELEKLKQFGTYEEVAKTGQYCISTTWVLWNKGESVRARLVARGYEDYQSYPRDSPTISKCAMRTILAIVASQEWQIKTTDIKSAFLQGKEIDREVYITPPKEANVSKDTIWKLRHCLYGLNDAARQFYKSVVECLQDLGCKQSTLDPALFTMMENGELIGIIACHVDDFLHAGTATFDSKVMEKLTERFLAGKVEGACFQYVGFNVAQDSEGITVDHSIYTRRIENGTIDASRAMSKQDKLSDQELTLFRQLVGRLNWGVQGSRPDLAFDLIDLSTKLKQASVSDLIRAIKCIDRLKRGQSVVKFPQLGRSREWKLVVYTDASLDNLEGSGSVGAYVCFLVNSENQACPLDWSATKIKRVVRSTLSAEMLSLQEGIDVAIYLQALMSEILNTEKPIPIVAFVDNKSVTQALCSTKMVDDKRLRLDVAAIKENLQRNEVCAIRWVKGEEQLANCLTKRGASGYNLMQVFKDGRLCF